MQLTTHSAHIQTQTPIIYLQSLGWGLFAFMKLIPPRADVSFHCHYGLIKDACAATRCGRPPSRAPAARMIRVATKNDNSNNNNNRGVATISLSDGEQDDVPKVPETSQQDHLTAVKIIAIKPGMGKGSSSSSHRSSRDTHNNNGRRRRRRLLSNCGGQLSALTRQPHGQSGTRKKEIQSGRGRGER